MMKYKDFVLPSLGVIAVIIGLFVFFPGIFESLGAMFSSQVNYCNDAPSDFSCVCSSQEIKTGFFPNWRCEPLPELSGDVSFPIETWEEANAYTSNLMGGFECSGDFFFTGLLEGDIPMACGKFGGTTPSGNPYLGHKVILECNEILTVDDEGRPLSGRVVWRIDFDPNDGWVYLLQCSVADVPSCPVDLLTNNNPKPDPQSTCGDTCCHLGETNATCASDCAPPPLVECSGEEVSAWVDEHGGSVAYFDLCHLVDGSVVKTGTSRYPRCNLNAYNCMVGNVRVLSWHTNPLGVCGAHRLLKYDQDVICPVIQ